MQKMKFNIYIQPINMTRSIFEQVDVNFQFSRTECQVLAKLDMSATFINILNVGPFISFKLHKTIRVEWYEKVNSCTKIINYNEVKMELRPY